MAVMNARSGTWAITLIMAVCTRLACAQEANPSSEAIPIVSVCQALQDRVLHNGKTIIVVGLMGGSDHGAWMNEKCEHTIVTDGFSWPNIISLAYSSVTDAPLKVPSNFHWDEKLLDAKRKEIEKRTVAKRDNPDDRWYAILGRFETWIPLQTVSLGSGRLMGYGFGHLNAAPAQLITDKEHRHELRAK
jgi:hypothetical protein